MRVKHHSKSCNLNQTHRGNAIAYILELAYGTCLNNCILNIHELTSLDNNSRSAIAGFAGIAALKNGTKQLEHLVLHIFFLILPEDIVRTRV